MDLETIEQVLAFLKSQRLKQLDLTGGAPELNANFRYLVERAVEMGVHVIDRSNLTILFESGQEDLAEFLARHKVEVVASLPCYLEENVDSQRGKGTYNYSIEALKLLNRLGYAEEGGPLQLNLVYNPVGATLPPPQGPLEADYKKQLKERFGVRFNRLFTITNMPIQRFGSMLQSKGQFQDYLQTLRDAYSPENLNEVMCRKLLSVDWQGYLYDCDFNQMLKIPLEDGERVRPHLKDLIYADLRDNPIRVAEHCYGCTAGQGSSCGGALED
jgi:radical SAM/Cys-rich protein